MKRFQFQGRKLVELSMDDYLLCDPIDAFDPSEIKDWIVPQPSQEVLLALQGVPHILEHLCKCYPEQSDLLRAGVKNMEGALLADIQRARDKLLDYSGNFVMVKDPAAYDASIIHAWNIFEVVNMEDILDKVVVDVGAGTGVVTWKCSLYAREIYVVEPVRRLREYIKRKAQAHCMDHIHVLEGTLGSIPLADKMTDTVIVAFVVSTGFSKEDIDHALRETSRVTKRGGKVAFIVPGLQSDECEGVFVGHSYSKSTMETPCDGGALIFRSSASVEDSGKGSYSGLFKTCLGVKKGEGIADAIKHAWASVFTPQALSYHRQVSQTSDYPLMAVLIMPLLDAKTAGVAFSTNPADGNPFQIVVTACLGLGMTALF